MAKAIEEMSPQEIRQELSRLENERKRLREIAKSRGVSSMDSKKEEFIELVRTAYEMGQKVREAEKVIADWKDERKDLNKRLVELRADDVGAAYEAGFSGSFGRYGKIVSRARGGTASKGLEAQKALLEQHDLLNAIATDEESDDEDR